MSKQVENFINQFSELENVVNAFRYEAVQIRVVDYILEVVELKNKEHRGTSILKKDITEGHIRRLVLPKC